MYMDILKTSLALKARKQQSLINKIDNSSFSLFLFNGQIFFKSVPLELFVPIAFPIKNFFGSSEFTENNTKMLSILTRCAVVRGARVVCPSTLRALSTFTPKFNGNHQKSTINVTSKASVRFQAFAFHFCN